MKKTIRHHSPVATRARYIYFAFFAFIIAPSESTQAATIWDQSPDAVGGSMPDVSWTNLADGQNFADPVQFASNVAVSGMDIYTRSSLVSIDNSVRIRIRLDSYDGPLLAEFDEAIDIIDEDGAISAIPDTVRAHATFTTPIVFQADIVYWVGMSGILEDINQMFATDTSGPLTDGRSAVYFGQEFQYLTESDDTFGGDMLFRLEGSFPVTEPAILTLMGLGLAGIGYKRHRCKKAA